jgi:hypothetical protein
MKFTLCRIGIHRWKPWEQYQWIGTRYHMSFGVNVSETEISEHRQRRRCAICNKEQDIKIKNG